VAEKYIVKSSEIAARMLGGEMMIMSVKDSTFFTLDPVATAIWQAADGRSSLSEIVARKICSEFDVTQEMALQDAEQLVHELAAHGILQIFDQPIQDWPTEDQLIRDHPIDDRTIHAASPEMQ
jgi:hypothetical protein